MSQSRGPVVDVLSMKYFILQSLARLGAKVTGVDASARNIHAALRHARHDPLVADRVQYMCTTVEELADKEPESFDCVVASEVIEHVTNKDTFISASAQLVRVSKVERKKRIKNLTYHPLQGNFQANHDSSTNKNTTK